MSRRALPALALVLAGCATGPSEPRSRSAAETLQWTFTQVCSPYVVDGVDRRSAAGRRHVIPQPQFPSVLSPREPGARYKVFTAGYPKLRLWEHPYGRGCSIQFSGGDHAALLAGLSAALAARPALWGATPTWTLSPDGYRRLCSRQGPLYVIHVSPSAYPEADITVQRATPASPACKGIAP